ncbi:MAG: hypothetical protein AAFO77_10250 [Pseudomonadota bacterium]
MMFARLIAVLMLTAVSLHGNSGAAFAYEMAPMDVEAPQSALADVQTAHQKDCHPCPDALPASSGCATDTAGLLENAKCLKRSKRATSRRGHGPTAIEAWLPAITGPPRPV